MSDEQITNPSSAASGDESTDSSESGTSVRISVDQLRWQHLHAVSDGVLSDVLEAATQLWKDAETTVAAAVAAQLTRELVNEMSIVAVFVRLSRNEEPEDDGGPVLEISDAWDDDGSDVDFEVIHDAATADNEHLSDRLADLCVLWDVDHVLAHLPSGTFFDGRTGKPAPWCQAANDLPPELADKMGVPEFEKMFDNFEG